MNTSLPHKKEIITVSQLTRYIKNLLEGDGGLYNLNVTGEISNFKRAYSGHCYFNLKDPQSVVSCVMFRSRADRVGFEIADGMMVTLRGNITLYEKGGSYQILVEEVKAAGIGELYRNFLKLKEKLEKKGYFEEPRKKEIPFFPRGIGIAASTQSAGIRDMIKTVQNKFPPARLYISPTIVQGADAPASIARSIEILNKYDPVEVIIIGRGGGSFEDLNCFNDEKVAQAIFKSKKPIITGIGHQTDFTIADMTADLRAATPTAAAEASVPDYMELTALLMEHRTRITRGLMNKIRNLKIRMESMAPSKMNRILQRKIQNNRQLLDRAFEKLERAGTRKIEDLQRELRHYNEKLNMLNPFRVIDRGYAIVCNEQSKIVSGIKDVNIHENQNIILSDGYVKTKILEKTVFESEKDLYNFLLHSEEP